MVLRILSNAERIFLKDMLGLPYKNPKKFKMEPNFKSKYKNNIDKKLWKIYSEELWRLVDDLFLLDSYIIENDPEHGINMRDWINEKDRAFRNPPDTLSDFPHPPRTELLLSLFYWLIQELNNNEIRDFFRLFNPYNEKLEREVKEYYEQISLKDSKIASYPHYRDMERYSLILKHLENLSKEKISEYHANFKGTYPHIYFNGKEVKNIRTTPGDIGFISRNELYKDMKGHFGKKTITQRCRELKGPGILLERQGNKQPEFKPLIELI